MILASDSDFNSLFTKFYVLLTFHVFRDLVSVNIVSDLKIVFFLSCKKSVKTNEVSLAAFPP